MQTIFLSYNKDNPCIYIYIIDFYIKERNTMGVDGLLVY